MTALIMPSDYGMEMVLGSSPVFGSGFLSGSPYMGDYSRCGSSVWPHGQSPLAEANVTTVSAKNAPTVLGFITSSAGGPADSDGFGFKKVRSAPGSLFRHAGRARRLGGVLTAPCDLQQTLKSCLMIAKAEEQLMPDGAVSPTKKKKVSFADMTGGNLTHIKVINEPSDLPPKWSDDFLEQLTGGAKAEALPDEWALTFAQPAADYLAWKSHLEHNSIALENVVIRQDESVIAGIVKVRNLSFKKDVVIRYTTNNWKDHSETKASYVPCSTAGMSYNLYDTFSFNIPLPNSTLADKVEFCLSYHADGCSYWDNNHNKNYTVVSFKTKKKNEQKDKTKDIYDAKNGPCWSEYSYWNSMPLSEPYW